MSPRLTRMRRAGARLAALVVLPLSIVPLVAVVPGIVEGHSTFAGRFADRSPLPAPAAPPAAALAPRPPVAEAVPVLAYNGIDHTNDGTSITPEAFAAQMAMLRRAGMHAITPEQYARWPGGSPQLPSRPILITFDDGRLDSYRHADAILDREGLRATMFAITGPIDAGSPFHLTWEELRRMQASGRWDVQLHAADAHTTIPAGEGRLGAAFVNRRWAGGELESFADYQERIRGELDRGMERLRGELGPIRADLFAIPYSAEGEPQTNDGRIPAFLDDELHRRFAQVFRSGRPVSPPREAQHVLRRYEVRSDTTPAALYGWLHTPPPAADEDLAPLARPAPDARPKRARSARRSSGERRAARRSRRALRSQAQRRKAQARRERHPSPSPSPSPERIV